MNKFCFILILSILFFSLYSRTIAEISFDYTNPTYEIQTANDQPHTTGKQT